MKKREQSAPRARNEGLLVQEMPDELLVYDLVRHKAHCLNQTAAMIWTRCDGKTSVKQMAAFLKPRQNPRPMSQWCCWHSISLKKHTCCGTGRGQDLAYRISHAGK